MLWQAYVRRMTDALSLPNTLPLFPLGGAILLPGEILPLNVFEPRYLNMLDDVRRGEGFIGIIQTREGGTPDRPALAPVGGAGRLAQFQETDDGRYLITLAGISRFRLTEELEQAVPYRVARADYSDFTRDLEPRRPVDGDEDQLIRMLQAWFRQERVAADWDSVRGMPLYSLVDRVAMMAPFSAAERQHLLEAGDTAERFGRMRDVLTQRLAGDAGGPMQ